MVATRKCHEDNMKRKEYTTPHLLPPIRRLVALALCLIPPCAQLASQEFPITDTVTEYRHKGTYYHDKFEGRKTSSGEVFDQNGFTAAHWKIKLGTYLLVTNANSGLQVIVKVNDRCPKHGVLDLSHRAATAIGIRGSQPVYLRILPEGYEERCLAQDALFDSVASRRHRPAVALEQPEPSVVATEEPQRQVQQPKPVVHKPYVREDDCYRIILGSVANHADAYGMIRMLPDIYQERACVETLTDDGMLLVYLDIHLRRSKAEDLCRALHRNFPNVSMGACP